MSSQEETVDVRLDLAIQGQTFTIQQALPQWCLDTDTLHRQERKTACSKAVYTVVATPELIRNLVKKTGGSASKCPICDLPSVMMLGHIFDRLNQPDPDRRRVHYVGHMYCGRLVCKVRLNQRVFTGSDAIAPRVIGCGLEELNVKPACQACGKFEGATWCARCLVIEYCSEECRVRDLSQHEEACRVPPSDGGLEE